MNSGAVEGFFENLIKERKNDVAVLKFYGIFLYNREKFRKSISSFKKALELGGDDEEILVYLMRACFADSDRAGALSAAETILQRDGAHSEARKMLARLALAAGNKDEAVRRWQHIAELLPGEIEAHLQLARIAWQGEDYQTAQECAKAALAVEAGNLESLDILVRSLYRLRQFDAVAELLPRYARADWARAIPLLNGLDAADAVLALARALKDLVGADPVPQDAAAWAGNAEFRWLSDGPTMEAWGDAASAAAMYRAVLTVRPDNREARTALNRLIAPGLKRLREVQKENRAADIETAASEVLALDADAAEAHFTLGRLCLTSGRPGQALAHLRAATAGEAGNAWFQVNLGRAAMKCGVQDEAVAAFQAVLAAAAGASEAYATEAKVSLQQILRDCLLAANRLVAEGHFHEAWARLAPAEKIGHDNGEFARLRDSLRRRMYSAVSALYRDAAPDTRAQVEEFLKIFPDDENALVMHGRLAMSERDFDQAVRSWQAAAAMVPDNSHYHLQIARCHAWLGAWGEAAEAAARALELDASLGEAQQIIAKAKVKEAASPRRQGLS